MRRTVFRSGGTTSDPVKRSSAHPQWLIARRPRYAITRSEMAAQRPIQRWRVLMSDYKKLGMLKHEFPNVPLMALTATATPRVLYCHVTFARGGVCARWHVCIRAAVCCSALHSVAGAALTGTGWRGIGERLPRRLWSHRFLTALRLALR